MGHTWKLVGLWTLTVLMAGLFLMAGATKLGGAPSQASSFARWGYPEWFIYVVGLAEAGGAVGLLIPRLAGFAAIVLGAVMIGASVTHFVYEEWSAVPIPLVLLFLLLPIAYSRREPVHTLLNRLLRRL